MTTRYQAALYADADAAREALVNPSRAAEAAVRATWAEVKAARAEEERAR